MGRVDTQDFKERVENNCPRYFRLIGGIKNFDLINVPVCLLKIQKSIKIGDEGLQSVILNFKKMRNRYDTDICRFHA